MKILFFSGHAHWALDPGSDRASGGAELQVALLARALAERGHEIVILGAETGQRDGVIWQGVKVRSGGRFDTGAPAETLLALPRVLRVLREERPDHVVVYGWTAWLDVLGSLRLLVPFRLAFVCALDAEIDGDFRRDNPWRGRLFDRGMRRADARFGITEHQARLFRAKGMTCAVTRLLLQDESVQPVPEKTVDLLWVARCHPVKQPHVFLDLAERLPGARCRMICSEQDRDLWLAVRDRAAKLPHVEFLEKVPYREIQNHFNAAKIFVNTSTHEGVPNTFIHSGRGRAAILSLQVDPDEMFRHFRAGLCAEGSFDRLVAGAVRLLAEPGELRVAQEESARFVKEWHGNAANLQAFLDGLSPRPEEKDRPE